MSVLDTDISVYDTDISVSCTDTTVSYTYSKYWTVFWCICTYFGMYWPVYLVNTYQNDPYIVNFHMLSTYWYVLKLLARIDIEILKYVLVCIDMYLLVLDCLGTPNKWSAFEAWKCPLAVSLSMHMPPKPCAGVAYRVRHTSEAPVEPWACLCARSCPPWGRRL